MKAMSITTIPPTRRSIIQSETGSGVIKDVPTPSLLPSEILVKTVAVAINPTDHKMPAAFPSPGAIIGCDFAGTIAQLGDNVQSISRLRVGDRVAGSVHGSNPIDHADGAFSEYIKTSADLVLPLPDSMSWETGAAIGGTGHGSLCLALRDTMGLSGTPTQPTQTPEYVLVYGGSTATGTMALQLLKLSGYKPIATCSPHNFSLARSYGAEAVYNHASPTVAADIRAKTHNTLFYALDCITDEISTTICYASIGRAGGRYVSLENSIPSLRTRKAVHASFALGYEMFGKRVALSGEYEREAKLEARDMAVEWYKSMAELCGDGKIKAHPVRVLQGRWEGVLRGIDLLRKGAVSGQKLVVRIDISS